MTNYPDITQLIPQRYPFLFIDKITQYSSKENLTAIKNTSADEWSVNFSDGAAGNTGLIWYPEVFIIEGAAQSAAAFFHLEFSQSGNIQTVFLGKVDAEFFAPVRLGDRILFKTGNFKVIKNGGFIEIHVESEDQKVAHVKIFCGF